MGDCLDGVYPYFNICLILRGFLVLVWHEQNAYIIYLFTFTLQIYLSILAFVHFKYLYFPVPFC